MKWWMKAGSDGQHTRIQSAAALYASFLPLRFFHSVDLHTGRNATSAKKKNYLNCLSFCVIKTAL